MIMQVASKRQPWVKKAMTYVTGTMKYGKKAILPKTIINGLGMSFNLMNSTTDHTDGNKMTNQSELVKAFEEV